MPAKSMKSAKKSPSEKSGRRTVKPVRRTAVKSPARPSALQRAKRDEAEAVVASLRKMSTKADRDNLSRFGITTKKSMGVSMANIQAMAKTLGRNHELAAALWDTGWYEARLLSAYVDEPARVTAAQMDRWAQDFDNWGVCDTVCFVLFDRTPHAWAKVVLWHDQHEEFVKRAAFALLACLAGHDRSAKDEQFLESLTYIERGAADDRNFIKKGISWALRRIGRRNLALNAAAVKVARRLSDSPDAAARWVGRGALKELTSAAVIARLNTPRGAKEGTK